MVSFDLFTSIAFEEFVFDIQFVAVTGAKNMVFQLRKSTTKHNVTNSVGPSIWLMKITNFKKEKKKNSGLFFVFAIIAANCVH